MHAMIDLSEPDAESGVAVALHGTTTTVEAPRTGYVEPALELGILAYQAAWDAGFRAEAERLHRAFAPLRPEIEHIGTTAVPRSAARPILDIAVGVAKPAAVQFLIETLRGYGYRERPTPSFAQRAFAREQFGLITHQVYLVEQGGLAWRQLLAFRDVLRADPRLAREYEWVRRRFAGVHPANRIAYARAKNTFIRTLVNAVH